MGDGFSLGRWSKKVDTRLDRIESILSDLSERIVHMSVQLDTLAAEVTEMTTVVDSAVALLNGLSAQIVALKDDPARLLALAADLDAKANELAAAVAANTPAAP
jgi:chromosome segregation ATPase